MPDESIMSIVLIKGLEQIIEPLAVITIPDGASTDAIVEILPRESIIQIRFIYVSATIILPLGITATPYG